MHVEPQYSQSLSVGPFLPFLLCRSQTASSQACMFEDLGYAW